MRSRFNLLIHSVTFFLVLLLAAACDTSPVVVIATPIPPDGGFRTYQHPSGVFTLRLPPNWSVRDVSEGGVLRVEFSAPGSANLPMSVYVVNTGATMESTELLALIDQYQQIVNAGLYTEVSRNGQGDGSWRLVGIRESPIGARQLNTFIQADGTFFSALEMDITNLDEQSMRTLQAVINTYRVNPNAQIVASEIRPVANIDSAVTPGSLTFSGIYQWTTPDGAFIVNGEVTNASGAPLEAVRVTATLVDAQGLPLASQQSILALEILEVGQTAPFSIRFQTGKPAQAVRADVDAVARGAEYSIGTHLGRSNFIMGNDRATYNERGYLTITADVVNSTQALARFVKAVVTVYDDQGRVVGTDSVFLEKPDLLPGEASRFDVVFFELGGNATRYEITLEGKTE
jgi:hypothetical protein